MSMTPLNVTDETPEENIESFFKDLAGHQEPLGEEFQRVLDEETFDLYEE